MIYTKDAQGRDLKQDLADQMREHSRSLHHQAETTGIVHRMLKGRCSLQAYVLYLRNLAVIYQTLERGFSESAVREMAGLVIEEGIYRSESIDNDLEALAGADWANSLPILQSTEHYQQRLLSLFSKSDPVVVAHAYVRYLGDLNGGRVLEKLLRERLMLRTDQLAFYRFEKLIDLKVSRQRLRESIDQSVPGSCAINSPAIDLTLAEVECAFRHNIALSVEVEQRCY